MKKIFLTFGVFALLTACSESTTTAGTETEAVTEPISAELAFAGQKVYKENCGSCHGLKVVKDYTLERWNKVLPNMAKRAKIEPEETASIYNYVKYTLAN